MRVQHNWLAKLIVFLCIVVPATVHVFGQNDSALQKKLTQQQLAFDAYYGSIYAHSIHIQNTKGAHPVAFDVAWSKRKTDSITYSKFGCYPRSGYSFTYSNFNTNILGKGYSVAVFIQPEFPVSRNLEYYIKGQAGLSYLTSPYDSATHPENQTYSLHTNFFLQLGTGLTYKLSDKVNITAGAYFMHHSNAGLQQPNRGINFPAGSIGIAYDPQGNRLKRYARIKDTSWQSQKPYVETLVYFSPKEGYTKDWKSTRELVAGIGINAGKVVSNLNALTVGAEVYYDAGIKSIKQNLGDQSSNTFAGILVGNEFIFGRILFSQQLGLYVFKHADSYVDIYEQKFGTIYHRWGLKYKLKEHWYAGINFLAHGKTADFIEGRVVYRW